MLEAKADKGETTAIHGADPFQNRHEKPMISNAGPTSRYRGRVVIELWESPDSTDVNQLGLLIDPADGTNGKKLLQDVATALPLHLLTLYPQ